MVSSASDVSLFVAALALMNLTFNGAGHDRQAACCSRGERVNLWRVGDSVFLQGHLLMHIYSVLGTEIVDIFVGPDLKHFKVHQKVLCETVPYFDKMLQGPFKEAVEHTVRLPEDDPDAFGLFLEWVYGGGLLQPADMKKHTSTNGPIFDRVKLYCFAEKICLDRLVDYTMTSLLSAYSKNKRSPSAMAISYAYEHSSSDSPLRKFALESFVQTAFNKEATWNVKNLSDTMLSSEDLRIDFLRLTMSGEALNIKTATPPTKRSPCTYHVHNKDEDCPFKNEVP
jgi:hypothetical protein